MKMHSHTLNNVRILGLEGRFDTYTASPVRQWIEEATVTEPFYIVINLEGVNFLDSTGLATLVQGMKRCRQSAGDLRLCGLQQPVRMIFELTRLDKAFEIFPGEKEAIEAFLYDAGRNVRMSR